MTSEGYTKERLRELKALPLERKVGFTAARIAEWYSHWNGNVYVSFSGGKDSTVLLHIARTLYPDIKAVYCDTGLEYPEIKQFVKTFDNVDIIRPKKSFKQVLDDEGYPVVSKAVAAVIKDARRGGVWGRYRLGLEPAPDSARLDYSSRFRVDKWQFLMDAPFKISDRCCDIMKKRPFHDYEKEHGKCKRIIATMTEESFMRLSGWLNTGCNAFNGTTPKSMPMSFWTEQDVLQYIRLKRLPIASVYGDIIETTDSRKRPKLKCSGCQRTGCMFCMFGVHCEKSPNRFQRMKRTHPQLWDYCINKLNCRQVLDYIHVPYEPDDDLFNESEKTK